MLASISSLQQNFQDLESEVGAQRRQTVFILFQGVSLARKEASCQCVWKGFSTQADPDTGSAARDTVLNKITAR
eukprot:2773505-Amphidinium_carterae.1